MSWLRLLPQLARRAASRTACTAGKSIATSTPMIAITTSSSTSVKAVRFISGSRPLNSRQRESRQSRALAVLAVGQLLQDGQLGLIDEQADAAVAESEVRSGRMRAAKAADPQRIARS